MNHLNTANLKDTIISTFQEILAEDPNFFLTDRLSVLTWKSKKIEGALITKIGNLRYLGLLRKDIKGQEYWKYKPLSRNSESEQTDQESPIIPPNSSTTNHQLKKEEISSQLSPTDNIAKFQQRQEQVNTYGKSNNSVEQSINEQSN